MCVRGECVCERECVCVRGECVCQDHLFCFDCLLLAVVGESPISQLTALH